jgi:hypothetical protein
VNALFGEVASVTPETVTLTDGRTAPFDPADRRAPALASVLEDLRQQRNAVHLELDEHGFVARVRIPMIVRVESITEGPDEIAVTLFRSHARHTLHRDARELLRALREASQDQWLAVTTTDAGEIIDARPWPPR